MKLNFLKGVLGCALAVALMTFTSDQAWAGVVIGSQLYSPVSPKLIVTYYDVNGNFKKLTVSSKDILLLQGFTAGNQLALGPGGDVYVIDKNTVLADLTATGFLSMNFNPLLRSETPPNDGGAFKFTEMGILSVNYYSDGGQDESNGHNSGYWFEISGAYASNGQDSSVVNNQQTVKTTFKASAMSGQGFDLEAFSINPANTLVPVTGSVSGSGSGKVAAAD